MKVLKFGGSSLATADRIRSVFDIIQSALKETSCAVVVSALGGATNELIRLSSLALEADLSYKEGLQALEKRHLDVVNQLVPVRLQSKVLAEVKFMLNELEDVLHGVYLVKERTPRTLDYVMSFGERLSAFIISHGIREVVSEAAYLDARQVIRSDAHFGQAKVDFATTNSMIKAYFETHPELQIITGFVASSESGETTTLGRSGSDYTAAIIAAAVHASSLEIWTDVDGMMSADPRKVKKAFTVKTMTYQEAMELSHFGAKVIFPSTMQPVMASGIPIEIKNTFNPDGNGTLISATSNSKHLIIKGISSIDSIALLNVQGSGLVGVVGVSMRLFETLASAHINVILISQASSEHSICFAIENRYSAEARQAIQKEFYYEIKNGDMDDPVIETDLAIVAIVGENMKHNPGTSGRMFSALGKNGINVYAIAQGSSELNISAVIRQSDTAKALNVLHEAFFLSDRKVVNLFLAGTGLIGKSLLRMIQTNAAALAAKSRLEINLVAVANSRKMLFRQEGIAFRDALQSLTEAEAQMDMGAYFEAMNAINLSNSIFVDCTSSEEITEYYVNALEANVAIVTPNKKANSGKLEKYKKLRATASSRNVKFLFETNVGAGLPVLNTLNDLLISGDKVIRIEAVLSGTLNYIFTTFSKERLFSDVVREAKEKGYTEPDPRDDLSGMDVARKILILARESGIDLELDDVHVQNLVPEDCEQVDGLDNFLRQLATHDHQFASQVEQAEARNEKLRYCATLEDGKATVSLRTVDASHPFYSLSGTDNIILLTTERYHERPMVIRGPGAGAEVTAAGVFADIIRIGNYIS